WEGPTAPHLGVQVWPDSGRTEELWRLQSNQGVSERTSYRPRTMIGVSTDFRLVTRITDLQDGEIVREIDNSANIRAELVSFTSPGPAPTIPAETASTSPADEGETTPAEVIPPNRFTIWTVGIVSIVLLAGVLIWMRRARALRPHHGSSR